MLFFNAPRIFLVQKEINKLLFQSSRWCRVFFHTGEVTGQREWEEVGHNKDGDIEEINQKWKRTDLFCIFCCCFFKGRELWVWRMRPPTSRAKTRVHATRWKTTAFVTRARHRNPRKSHQDKRNTTSCTMHHNKYSEQSTDPTCRDVMDSSYRTHF